jgi:hypothetical protein
LKAPLLKIQQWTLSAMHIGCCFTVKGCSGARKQDMKIFLSFNQAKTGQLDKR